MNLKQGIPKISDTMSALKTEGYKRMAEYSREYLDKNSDSLTNYPWIRDALNQWSRIYEYSFCYQELNKYLSKGGKVLDAGSGITFFPFFLSSMFNVTCLDRDNYFDEYRKINYVQQTHVNFNHCELHTLSIPDGSYDAVYCISVLEHTNRHEDILKEFYRVLRPEGILVLTFDIDINERGMGLAPDRVNYLVQVISNYFELSFNADNLNEVLSEKDLYTTNYVRTWNPSLLPWPPNTLSGFIRNVFNLKKTKHSNLAFGVLVAKKQAVTT